MNVSDKFCSVTYHFKGLWGVESKCGLRLFEYNGGHVVVVSELYRENPGTSITQAACILVKQICDEFSLNPEKLVYIEHNPDMNSKLSFYDEEFFEVAFDYVNGDFLQPKYRQLSPDEVKVFFAD